MYDNWNCVCCGKKYCNCGGGVKCSCQSATSNDQMKKVLTTLGIWPMWYRYWMQNERTREIIDYMMNEYVLQSKPIDTAETINKFKEDIIMIQWQDVSMKTKCEFNLWLSNDKCIYCWRPKWHVDIHWWDCNVLIWLNK